MLVTIQNLIIFSLRLQQTKIFIIDLDYFSIN